MDFDIALHLEFVRLPAHPLNDQRNLFLKRPDLAEVPEDVYWYSYKYHPVNIERYRRMP